MYERLLARRDLYQLAVGSLPELVSDAIKREVASRLGGEEALEDPLAELQRIRENVQITAIEKVWSQDANLGSASQGLRVRMAAVIEAAVANAGGSSVVDLHTDARDVSVGSFASSYTLNAGEANSLTLRHPLFDWLGTVAVDVGDADLLVIEATPNSQALALGLRRAGRYHLVDPQAVVELLEALTGLHELPEAVIEAQGWDSEEAFLANATSRLEEAVLRFPAHERTKVPRPEIAPPIPGVGSLSVRRLGRITAAVIAPHEAT
jgi:hypothetical protein